MKKHILLFFICLISVWGFIACKKNNSVAKSKAELLMQKPWRMTEAGYDSNSDGTIDQAITLDPCDSDDIITFLANNGGTWDDGPTKCNPDDPQIQSFTWSFANAETYLNLDTYSYRIVTLSETDLIVSFAYEQGGILVTEVWKFKH